MEEITMQHKGEWWVSPAIADSDNCTFRLSIPDGKCVILVETTTIDTSKPWATQYSRTVYGGEWEKNIVGIAPGQSVRVKTSVKPTKAYSQSY